jgi:hydrogenase expression/formation protein HypE
LHRLVAAMLAAGEVHALRDPTRGGLGTSLCEIAEASRIGIEIEARAVPVAGHVRAACELLGIDPLFVANEGKLVAFVEPANANAVLKVMRGTPEGRDAVAIGRAVEAHPGIVVMKTEIGGSRIIDLPFHEQLPRIC